MLVAGQWYPLSKNFKGIQVYKNAAHAKGSRTKRTGGIKISAIR